MKLRIRSGGAFLLSFFLCSCAAIPPSPLILTDTHWRIEAKISYSDSRRTKNALLLWQQEDQEYTARISGILGGELAWLKKTRDGFEMRARGKSYYAVEEAKKLIEEATTMHIPINGLAYWIKGEAVPSIPFEDKQDRRGRRVFLKQSGWEIHYSDYEAGFPRRMTAENPPYRILLAIGKISKQESP